MPRTAIRYTLSALAALALVSAFAGSPASAQTKSGQSSQTPNAAGVQTFGIMESSMNRNGASEPKAPKGLATKTPLQRSGSGMISKDSGISSALSRW